jgi:hypothetical protein
MYAEDLVIDHRSDGQPVEGLITFLPYLLTLHFSKTIFALI